MTTPTSNPYSDHPGVLPPHRDGRLVEAGLSLPQGETPPVAPGGPPRAIIAVHGRGAGAEDILGFAASIAPPYVTLMAPQAVGNTWYPLSFLAPRSDNEPGISSGLSVIDALVERLHTRGVPAEQVVILGFSQGACLAGEYVARHPRRYGGVLIFSGGLIGETVIADTYIDGTTDETDLDGTPVFLGCSDVDPHIPAQRVDASAEIFTALGGSVTKRLYPGMGHTINREEMDAARRIVRGAVVDH